MLAKIKKFIKNNKKLVVIISLGILALIILIVLYKMLFYSTAEKSVYGVRLTDIKENKIDSKEKNKLLADTSDYEKIENVDIKIKGRLIKYFITFNEKTTNKEMEKDINSIIDKLSEKIKGYYDVTIYAEKIVDDEKVYPLIGYKHKGKDKITYDEIEVKKDEEKK